MLNAGNGYWINKKYITAICSISDGKRSMKNLKDKGFSWKIISLSGNRANESCIFTQLGVIFTLPFSKETMEKRFQSAEDIEPFLKCGNGNWISGKNTLLVVDSQNYTGNKLWTICKSVGDTIDFTQNKGTKCFVITKDFTCFRSPLNANTTAGHGRKIEEKKKKII